MKNTYYKTCPECGALLDPNETCSCKAEEVPDNSVAPVLDDSALWFEIEAKDKKPVELAYMFADDPQKQWYVFYDNACVAYDCTLLEALMWAFDRGYIPINAVETLQKDIEKTIQDLEEE